MSSQPPTSASPTQAALAPAPFPRAVLPRLVSFAQARLAAGVGVDRLHALGLGLPHLLADADAGILPADYRDALPRADAERLGERGLGNVLLLPACDGGTVVDVAGIDLDDGTVRWSTLWDEPAGLLLPRVPGPAGAVLVVASWPALVACARAGHRRVLWVRSVGDAAANAPRLRAAGVERVTLVGPDAAAFSPALVAAGITVDAVPAVEPVPPPPPAPNPTPLALRRVSWDREARRAVFAAADLAVVVDLGALADLPTEVLLRRDDLQHRDRFRLGEQAACDRFARAAARRFACPVERIQAILAALPAALAALVDVDDALPATTEAEDAVAADEAEGALAAGDLVERFDADLTALGWVGDPQPKLLALLTLAGRGLADPPWLHLRGERAHTLPILARLAACVPAERRLATPGGVLPLRGDVDLRHGVLVLDDGRRLRPDDALALRLLQAHGSAALGGLGRDAAGRLASRPRSVRGPVTVLAACDGDAPLDDLAVVTALDDSPAQTARIQAAAQQAHRQGGDQRHGQRLAARWQAILRRVTPSPVVVPCADRICFPATQPRHRREHALFLALVDAAALLHQRQRPRQDGAVVATEADVLTAIRAAQGVLGVTRDGLSPRAGEVLVAIRSAGLTSATTPEVAALVPQMPRRSLRDGLDELVSLDLLAASAGGRGRRPRRYHLLPSGATTAVMAATPAIRLAGVAEMAEMAVIGGARPANISPVVAAS